MLQASVSGHTFPATVGMAGSGCWDVSVSAACLVQMRADADGNVTVAVASPAVEQLPSTLVLSISQRLCCSPGVGLATGEVHGMAVRANDGTDLHVALPTGNAGGSSVVFSCSSSVS